MVAPALVAPDDHAAIVAAMLTVLAFAVSVEQTRLGKLVPGSALTLIVMVVATNAGLLPHSAPAYEEVARAAVPIGVFLLLLRANIVQILNEAGAMLPLYLIGAGAAIVGVLVAAVVVPVEDATKIAAAQTANLVGGTVNVVAVAHALALDATRFTAMLAGAGLVMTLYLAAMGMLGANPRLRRWLPVRTQTHEQGAAAPSEAPVVPFSAPHLSLLLAAAVAAYAFCARALALIGKESLVTIAVSVIALAAANLAPKQIARLSGDREVGAMLMYLFFATLGASVDLRQFGGEAVMMAAFVAVAIVIHLLILLPAAKLLKADLHETLVASIAGIGGPATAAAMAASFDRRALITPGVLCGLLGFATSTFLGMALYGLLLRL